MSILTGAAMSRYKRRIVFVLLALPLAHVMLTIITILVKENKQDIPPPDQADVLVRRSLREASIKEPIRWKYSEYRTGVSRKEEVLSNVVEIRDQESVWDGKDQMENDKEERLLHNKDGQFYNFDRHHVLEDQKHKDEEETEKEDQHENTYSEEIEITQSEAEDVRRRLRPQESNEPEFLKPEMAEYDPPESVARITRLQQSSDIAEINQRQYEYNLTFFTMDFNQGIVQDLKHHLGPKGVRFVDKSLSQRCDMTNSCSDMEFSKGLTPDNLDVFSIVNAFYHVYEESQRNKILPEVDTFLCIQPAAMCQIYQPFNKTLIVLAADRYELGTQEPAKWLIWNRYIEMISKSKKHVLAATNTYDIEYIRYFTMQEAMLLPPLCDYITTTYSPVSRDFLLYPIRRKSFADRFLDEYEKAFLDNPSSRKLVQLEDLYQDPTPRDLVQHRGIVIIPHQVSFLRFTEIYRMNIPIFVPSLELLTKWHHKYQLVYKKSLHKQKTGKANGSPIEGKENLPDPNDDEMEWAIGFWLEFADYYMYPKLIYFTSVKHLVKLIRDDMDNEKLMRLSNGMQDFNLKSKMEIKTKWDDILKRIWKTKDKF